MTTNKPDNPIETKTIEHYKGFGLSGDSATTAISIYENLGSSELALPDSTIAEIAEFYDRDIKKAVRVATILGSVALVEVVNGFEENDYLDYLINKLESVGLGHIAEDQTQLREFASEIGVDLSLGFEFGLMSLLDKLSLMSRDELIEVAESVGITAEEVDIDDIDTDDDIDIFEEDEELERSEFTATNQMDDDFDRYLEDVKGKVEDLLEDDESASKIIIDDDEVWVIE